MFDRAGADFPFVAWPFPELQIMVEAAEPVLVKGVGHRFVVALAVGF